MFPLLLLKFVCDLQRRPLPWLELLGWITFNWISSTQVISSSLLPWSHIGLYYDYRANRTISTSVAVFAVIKRKRAAITILHKYLSLLPFHHLQAKYIDRTRKRVVWTHVDVTGLKDDWPIEVLHTLCISCIYTLQSVPFGFKQCLTRLYLLEEDGRGVKRRKHTINANNTALVKIILLQAGTQNASCRFV